MTSIPSLSCVRLNRVMTKSTHAGFRVGCRWRVGIQILADYFYLQIQGKFHRILKSGFSPLYKLPEGLTKLNEIK